MVAGANRARVVGIGGVEVVRIAEQGSVSERGIIVSGRGRVSGVGHGGTYSGVREGGEAMLVVRGEDGMWPWCQ